MKTKTKNNFFLVALVLISSAGFSQGPPWFTGGNVVGVTDFLGSTNSAPLRLRTDNVQRMQINENLTSLTTVAAGNQIKNGFIGINTPDPWSRLHVRSGVSNLPGFGGYRAWMREGILFQSVTDQLWLGIRQWGPNPQIDEQNAIINWGDDQGGGASVSGPDHLIFNYTETSQGNATYPAPSVNPNPATFDGREIMRLTNLGNVGIGPRFNNGIIPQSTLHQHQENNSPSWMQITNQFSSNFVTTPQSAPTNITANDGMRWGIDANNNAYLYNQENHHLLFSTNKTVNAGANAANERVRITQIGAAGIPNPGTLPNDITRMSISRNPNTPVTSPLSLLHLGYNTGAGNDGWRPWMDIGSFASNGTDHVFIGLKDEGGNILSDRQDAVIAWGDNQTANGPDNFRFIFTSSAAGTAPANGANGLEAMRMTPTSANNVYTGIGGVPGTNNYNGGSQNPTQTLEVNSVATTVGPANSGLRFTDLTNAATPLANPTGKILSVNATGDVILVQDQSGAGSGITAAQNGLSLNGGNPNIVEFGAPAGSAAAANLLNNREVPMNGQFLQFSGNGNFGIGGASGAPVDKLHIRDNQNSLRGARITNSSAGASAFASLTFENDINNVAFVGLASSVNTNYTNKLSMISLTSNIHIEAQSNNHIELIRNGNSHILIGGINPAISLPGVSSQYSSIISDGCLLDGVSASSLPQFVVRDYDGTSYNNISYLGDQSNAGSLILYNPVAMNPVQILMRANDGFGNALVNIGNTASAGMLNVQGSVHCANLVQTSDSTLKTNIQGISSSWATTKVKAIRPVSYEWTNPIDTLQYGTKYGFTAQQVETAIPNLVFTDSAGRKSLDYNGIIALLAKALQNEIRNNEKQDSLINQLTSIVNSCCSNSIVKSTSPESQQQLSQTKGLNNQNITLSDGDVLVLNQNQPNPFAEQTTITYNVPNNYGTAQLIFTTIDGRVIKTVDLKKGRGQLNVYAQDLSMGIYVYSLVVDGKTIESKKMVKQN